MENRVFGARSTEECGWSFGERLRSFRGRAGLPQHELAERAGVSVRTLRDIEQGRVRRPQTRTVQLLADALGLDADAARQLSPPAHGAVRPAGGRSGDRRPGDERLHIGILGPLSVRYRGAETPVQATKVRRLLALLALQHPEPAGLGEITHALWPDDPPRSYQSLVHTYVSQARRLLLPSDSVAGLPAESFLTRTHTGYALALDRDQVDLTRFQDLSLRARQAHRAGDTAAAHDLAGRAYRCWRGPLLAGEPLLPHHPAATAAARQRVESLLLYADLALQLHRPGQVVQALRGAAEEEPLHEGLQAALMLALASCGEQQEALRVFAAVTAGLDQELGVQPGDELRRAHLRILHQELPWPRTGPVAERTPAGATAPVRRLPTAPPPTAPPRPRPSQIPAASTGFVGRGAELEQLDRLLLPTCERDGQVPAALVTGFPGVGKTALAVRWAHRVRERFPDGQLYGDLHGYGDRRALDPGKVLASFLRALGVRDTEIPDTLDEAANLYRTLLSDRRMLIVLDNAREESQIRPLVPGTARCAVLVTSRNTLPGLVARDGVPRIALDVLDRDEALALLGQLVRGGRVEAEPLAARALVRHCGGLPLAVRLLAARVAEYPGSALAQLCVELQEAGAFTDLPVASDDLFAAAHAAFEPSYRSMPEPVRRCFRLLARTGGRLVNAYTMADLAQTTPPEATHVLRRLVGASLLRECGPGRFSVPAPLLRYARRLALREDTERLQAV
ncbi:BTAD domain-containing putative transcriptional regulator [Streptomyces sp. NPDC005533]|uniref:BTAD domain-containing putative transcriptional regulator n=1 Tax=Streptomyces sp. NPDC005533 TaxID=3364723 RepID=UPI0036BA11EB